MSDPLLRLLDLMAARGATAFYAKRLAPNDNSKNQVYLGGGFAALNIIPHGGIEEDDSQTAGSVRDRAKAPVRFFWMTTGQPVSAPGAQLILYPKYPEVRMSGFLRGADHAPADLMASRADGRVLILGICPDGRVLGEVRAADDPLTASLNARVTDLPVTGVFIDLLPLRSGDTRAALLAALRAIHLKGWIESCKIGRSGLPEPYSARNGGGYTLEAQLGISPNGYAEPDYLGWEIKQYGVGDFTRYMPKSPVTLMTPEPTGGYYREAGVEAFLRRYGYPDKSGKESRINFGGIYAVGRDFHADTGLSMTLTGFDAATGRMTDIDGNVALLDRAGNAAAVWAFRDLMAHWTRKHAKAAYVPSLMRTPPPEYSYGDKALLCEGTDVLLLLSALAQGRAYYDPGIKLEGDGTTAPKIKRRSQFRIAHGDLPGVYVAAAVAPL